MYVLTPNCNRKYHYLFFLITFTFFNAFSTGPTSEKTNLTIDEQTHSWIQQQKSLLKQFIGDDIETLSESELKKITSIVLSFGYGLVHDLTEKKKKGIDISLDPLEEIFTRIDFIHRLERLIPYLSGLTAVQVVLFSAYIWTFFTLYK